MVVRVTLKRLHSVTSKGKTYHYAWRGGPRIKGTPGTPGFMAAYNEAVQEAKAEDNSRFASLVTRYKASADYKNLSPSTKRTWAPWLDKIKAHFGALSIAAFNRTHRIRPNIIRWRGSFSSTKRAADTAMQVLSRVCAYGIDPLGEITVNPCEGIKRLYKNDRSEIIWSDTQIAQLKLHASDEIGWAVDLAAYTGLRQGDLLRLCWTHIGELAIELPTSKSNSKRSAYIPRYGALNELLAQIPRRAASILTSSRQRPWTSNGFQSSFNDAKTKASMNELGLHFHDLRGTAATKFYIAGIKPRVIAEILGWDEETVERIIGRYVDRQAATKALIAQLDEQRTKAVKPDVKLG